jgi:hypothetical protein
MDYRYKKHYTREEARELLPEIQKWLGQLVGLRDKIATDDQEVSRMLGLGDDLGGPMVNRYLKGIADIKDVFKNFLEREIQVKDLDRGLIDFPAFIGGKEVFLCWEKGEDDIEFWHDIDAGYAGRERL